ncbi:hypothetical protein BOTBODRAFT_139905, partial [Botryobasidium botryosum FD-172 SS1]
WYISHFVDSPVIAISILGRAHTEWCSIGGQSRSRVHASVILCCVRYVTRICLPRKRSSRGAVFFCCSFLSLFYLYTRALRFVRSRLPELQTPSRFLSFCFRTILNTLAFAVTRAEIFTRCLRSLYLAVLLLPHSPALAHPLGH